jgi:hypothetical protein
VTAPSGTDPIDREPTVAAETAWLVQVARELVSSGAVAVGRRRATIATAATAVAAADTTGG